MYYDTIQNDIGAERAFLEASRFNVHHPVKPERPVSAEKPPVEEEMVNEDDTSAPPAPVEGEEVVTDIPVVQGNWSILLFFPVEQAHTSIVKVMCDVLRKSKVV